WGCINTPCAAGIPVCVTRPLQAGQKRDGPDWRREETIVSGMSTLATARQITWYGAFAASALVLLVPRAAAQSQSLIKNGSFEQGAPPPDGWQLMPGGSWASGSSHRGTRHLHGVSAPEAMVCEGPLLGLEPGVDYRLEGWLRSPAGWAR